ncbi:MAG: glycosyltransferase [Ginsengibacter sp.]
MTDHHICFNPRVWKEALYYEKKGVEVVILSMWIGQEYLERDLQIIRGHAVIYKPYLNLIPGEAAKFIHFFYRARKRISGEMQRLFGIGLPEALSYAPAKMVRSALRENADHYSAHLECAFGAGNQLLKKGKNVSFDFEDWYSQDFLVPERPVRLLQSLEQSALEKGLFCTCTSVAMKNALQVYYGRNETAVVIYNGFSLEESSRIPTHNKHTPNQPMRAVWFSRSIGPDRGIEPFMQSLSECKPSLELHFLGKMEPGYQLVLENLASGNQIEIVIHPFINHAELMPFISGFDMGLAIDVVVNRNRDVTITNKILQYLQAGLPVLASDTAGHREVAAYFSEKVKVVNIHNPAQVADAILQLKEVKQGLSYEEQRRFEENFSWEAQEKKLDELVKSYYEW